LGERAPGVKAKPYSAKALGSLKLTLSRMGATSRTNSS
jgi:hypothetical protein